MIGLETDSKFFEVVEIEGIPEIILGSADFVSRPIILLAQEDLINFIDANRPARLVINFKNVLRDEYADLFKG